MFSNGYVAWLVRREYNRDRAHEADRYRLVKQTCLVRRRRDPFYCQALAWLGQRLVHWGLHLQERYAALADPVLLDAANQTR